MPLKIKRKIYYRTKEACQLAGISRSTLLRWLGMGILEGASHQDRRGWRLFTETDIKRIKAEANKIN